MEEKLKSILRQIRWSLVLKGAIFALAWIFLPWWLFAIVALFLYFVPAVGAGTVVIPFLTLLAVSFFELPNAGFALMFGAIFAYILFIKDFLIIDRKTAYEMLSVVLIFLLVREFYLQVGGSFAGWGALYGFGVAALEGALVAGFIKHFSEDTPENERLRTIAGWTSFIVGIEFLFAGLLLPMDFINQSAIAFLSAVFMIDILPQHFFEGLTREKLFITSGLVFCLIAVILASVQWRI